MSGPRSKGKETGGGRGAGGRAKSRWRDGGGGSAPPISLPTATLRDLMTLPALKEIATTCPYCGTGCGQTLQVAGGRLVGARGHADWPSSQGALCVKGRYAYDFVHSSERLTAPLIRRHKEGELEPVSWDEALAFTGTRLAGIRAQYGPDSVGAAASSRCTNEDSYALTKLMRAVLGSNHIDNCQRN